MTKGLIRLLPLALMLGWTGLAQAQSEIGTVLVTKGQVSARAADGTVRPLARRVVIFERDTVLVEGDGYAQLKLLDDAMLALGPDTEFSLNSYRFDGDPVTPDSATMSLVRGCLITITGRIGDAAADEYRVDTPLASIGVIGTVHSVMVSDEVLYTGTYEGATRVSNSRGFINLGIGSSYDFSRTLPDAAPEGLVTSPDSAECLPGTLNAGSDTVNPLPVP